MPRAGGLAPRGAVCFAGAVLGAVLVILACSPSDPVVARGQGWKMTRGEVQAEYDRLRGEGSYARTTPASREAFLETLVKKKLLLDEAQRTLGGLDARGERRVRAEFEDYEVRELHRHLRNTWKPDSLLLRRVLGRFSREAHVQSIVTKTFAAGESCRKAIDTGLPFEQAHHRFAGKAGQEYDLGWKEPLWFPPHVTRAIFFDDLPAGRVAGPIVTRRGVWVARVLEYRPLDLRSRPGLERRTRAILDEMLYKDVMLARQDSLRKAAGLAFHPESFEAVGRAARSYLDSLRTARRQSSAGIPETGSSGVRPPVWRLTPAERALPVAEMDGKTVTAEEFLAGLEGIDVSYWPVSEQAFPLESEVKARIDRILDLRDAARLGLDRSEAWRRARERQAEEMLLDELHDRIVARLPRVTPAQAESLYRTDPSRWKTPVRLEFAAVIFPRGDEEEAERFARQVHGVTPAEWTTQAEGIEESVEGTRFIRTSDILDADQPPDPPEWAPLLETARGLKTGEISGAVPAPEMDGTAVVRLIYRSEERPLEHDVALVMAAKQMSVRRVEASLSAMLKEARAREAVETMPSRLAPIVPGARDEARRAGS